MEDDDTLTENSTMSSITCASKGKKITDLTDDSTVLTNEDSTNRLMIWNDKYVKLLGDGGWKCLWRKKINVCIIPNHRMVSQIYVCQYS